MLAFADRLAGGEVEHEDLAVVLQVKGLATPHRDIVGIAGRLERTALPDHATIESHPRHERRPLGMRRDDERIVRHHDGGRPGMIARPPAVAHARAYAHQIFAAQALRLERPPFVVTGRGGPAVHVEAVPGERLPTGGQRQRPREFAYHPALRVVDRGRDIGRLANFNGDIEGMCRRRHRQRKKKVPGTKYHREPPAEAGGMTRCDHK